MHQVHTGSARQGHNRTWVTPLASLLHQMRRLRVQRSLMGLAIVVHSQGSLFTVRYSLRKFLTIIYWFRLGKVNQMNILGPQGYSSLGNGISSLLPPRPNAQRVSLRNLPVDTSSDSSDSDTLLRSTDLLSPKVRTPAIPGHSSTSPYLNELLIKSTVQLSDRPYIANNGKNRDISSSDSDLDNPNMRSPIQKISEKASNLETSKAAMTADSDSDDEFEISLIERGIQVTNFFNYNLWCIDVHEPSYRQA